jgi:hypothetical protein
MAAPPFLLRFLAPRAIPGVEVVDAESYRRVIALGGKAGAIEVRLYRARNALDLRIDFPEARALILIVDKVQRVGAIYEAGGDAEGVAERTKVPVVAARGIDIVELAGVDQAHEQVPQPSAVLGFVAQRVFPVEDRHLQGPLADIVIQGRAGLAQEQGQGRPVVEHVVDGLAQTAIGDRPITAGRCYI